MSNIVSGIKTNYKLVISVIISILLLPVIVTLTKIIFEYGNYIGTLIRYFVEKGVCF